MPTEVSTPERHEQPPKTNRTLQGREDADEDISFLDLMIVVAERKRLIFTITGVAAALSIVVSLILPPRYKAEVTLLPPQQNSSMAAAMASQLGSLGSMASIAGGALGLKNPNDMYAAMIKSRTVEDGIIQRFGLMQEYHSHYLSDARKSLEGRSTIDGNGKDGLIHIAVEDRDPKRAATLANGYVDEFRHLTEHLAIGEAAQRRLFFEQQLKQAKDNLANAEAAMELAQNKTGMIAPEGQTRALIESAAALRGQIAAKEVQIQSLETFATPQNDQLVQAQRELAGLQEQLGKLGGAKENNDADIILPRGQISQAGIEYLRHVRDVKYYETIFDILARQFELAKLDEAKEGAVVQVVDPAIPPDRRSFPHRSLIVIGSTFVGFLIALLVAFVQAGLERMRCDPELSAKFSRLRHAIAWTRR